MFEKIKYYYSKGFYKDEHLDKLLAVGVLTQDEYNEIKGEKYRENY